MARNDIRLHDTGGLSVVPTQVYQVAASATTILAGEPVKLNALGDQQVIKFVDGDPTTSTGQVVGIAAKDSTNTASAAGTVEVYLPCAGQVTWKAKAKTASTADSQSEIDTKANDCIVLDLTSSVFTVDFATAHANTNGIQVVGGDPNTQEIYFKFRPIVTEGATA